MTGLARTMRRSSAGQLLAEVALAGAEQDEGGEVVAVLVGLLVHVEEGVDRLGAEAVDVEDDGVGGRLAEPLGGALGVGDEDDAVAHLRERLAEGVLDLGLGLDAEACWAAQVAAALAAVDGRIRTAAR